MQEQINIIVFLVIGAGALVGYFEYRKKRKRIIDNGIEVEGIVFDFAEDNQMVGDTSTNTPMPLIRFVTKEGLWMTEKGEWGSTSLEQGDKVIVVYNADNPKEFIFKNSKDWGHIMGYLFLIVGIVGLVIGSWRAYQYLTNNG